MNRRADLAPHAPHAPHALSTTSPWRLAVLLLAAAAALVSGPLAGLLANGDPAAVVTGAIVAALPLALLLGVQHLDLALLAVNFAAIAFFTAIRHRSTAEAAAPHPFYEWTLLRLTVPELLTLAALAVHGVRGRVTASAHGVGFGRVALGAVPWLFATFFAWSLAVGLANGNTLETCLRDGRKLVYVALAHVLVVAIAPDAARRHRLLQAIGLALLAAAVVTIADWWSERGFHYRGVVRASVDVSDFLGCLGAICVPVALLRSGMARSRVACVAAIVVGVAATLCTFSRAAWCAAPVALAIVLLHPTTCGRPASRAATWLVVAAALAAPFLFSGVADQALHRIEALFDPAGDPSVSYRVRELRGAAQVALDHPLTGVGLGTRFDVGASLIDRRRDSATLVHHVFLWSAVKGGLPGLLLIAGGLVAMLLSLSRSARRQTDPHAAALALGLLGLLVGFVVIGQVGAMLNQARTAFLLGAVSGLARTLAVAPVCGRRP
ncbi:MAG: O-antigen ligase domain-containing protein [Planctomycetes bacterium]|nr:O-antigen ligase domain-containing protein [Planctomycetota bacterium]